MLGTGTLRVSPSAIITVNSIADTVDDLNSGTTTLRDAINQANGDTGSDVIVFDRSLFASAQTITLSLGELDITHNTSIIAPRDSLTGGDLVTVSGNNASRVFEIETGATVSLDGLIVADGLVTDDNGGGIKNSGTLTLDSSIVRGDSARRSANLSPGNGGGISNSGTFTVSNSTISGNLADRYGGGIYNSGGMLIVSDSSISDNTIGNNLTAGGGGGICNSGGILMMSNSIITGNSAGSSSYGGGIDIDGISVRSNVEVINSIISSNEAGYGGGIYNFINSNLTVSNSTISSNSGCGIFNSSILKVSNSTISNNLTTGGGGGICNSGTSTTVSNCTISGNSARYDGGGINGSATVSNSTIIGNSAGRNGGGIYNDSTSTVSNSTISGNTAIGNGGGIYNDYYGTLTLVFNTLTLNSAANGSGVFNVPRSLVDSQVLPSHSASMRNTIIAANLNSTNGVNPDVSGTFTSNGYNLIGDSTGSTGFGVTGDIVGTSDNPIDPRLAPLDFYGGPTQTIALLPDSPAIDAGDPTILDTDPTTDQRGNPRVSNGRADIGAFEVQV